MLTNKQEIMFFSFLGFLLLFFVTLIYLVGAKVNKEEVVVEVPNTPLPIEEVDLKAKAAIVYDTNTGLVLFSKNPNDRLPLASLTKMMSALVANESAPNTSTVIVSNDALRVDGDAGLIAGERWTIKDLLDFSLVSSANDGIRAIALALGSTESFVEKMNRKASTIGMKNTYYLNDTGLDLEEESVDKAGAYGSVYDQVLLMKYVLEQNPEIFSATKEPRIKTISQEGHVYTANNTNVIVNHIPGLIASKTGFTDLAGGNLLIAFDPEIGRPIIIAILGSTENGRFEDMQKLVDLSLLSVQNSVISTK